MGDKAFLGVIGIVIVAIVGAVLIFGGESSGAKFIGDPLEIQTGQSSDEEGNVQPADHVLGADAAPVTLIEYADFECPACKLLFDELVTVKAQYADDIQIVFRHNPLSQIHPNAFAAHRAAVAASNQGKFWEMHDLLYERWPTWAAQTSGSTVEQAAENFKQMASEIGLDMEQYAIDIASEETFNYIDSHLDSGGQLGVQGTPTLFLNGELVETRSAEEIIALIEEVLSQNETAETDATTEAETSEE